MVNVVLPLAASKAVSKELPESISSLIFFKRQESGMPFVDVAHFRPDARRLKRSHSADAEKHFLLQAQLMVAPVQAGSKLLSSGLFLLRSVSSKYTRTVPTRTIHTWAWSVLPGISNEMKTSSSLYLAGHTGSLEKNRSSGTPRSVCPRYLFFCLKYPSLYKSPTPTKGTPRSLAALQWSPARTPSPPE